MWKAMREDGATYEAIAKATGVGIKTVQRNLETEMSNDNSGRQRQNPAIKPLLSWVYPASWYL
jgi:hypothetical protein